MPDSTSNPLSEFAYVVLKSASREMLAIDEEPSHFVRRHEGKVLLVDDDGPIEIGAYRAYYVDAEGALCAGMPLFDVFDSLSEIYPYLQLYDAGDFEYSPAAKKAAKADYLFEPNLLILDRLEILPRYRGRGYGLQALIGMMHWFQAGAGLVAMKPFPLQFEAHDRRPGEHDPMELERFATGEVAARTKLRRYYAQLGFKLVPKTHFMVRRVDQAPPPLPSNVG